MDWWIILAFILGSLIVLMLLGMPTAFCFLVVSMGGAFVFFGGEAGLKILSLSIRTTLGNFSMIAMILFMLMGTVLFSSGIAPLLIEAINKWLGHLPGRLGILSVAAGTLIATLSGSSMASCAMLGSVLLPEMGKYHYQKSFSMGTIMACGGLAMLIPPSSMAVLIAIIANMSVGRLLIAMIVPGIILAIILAIYVIVRCWMQPDIAPPYSAEKIELSVKLRESAIYVLPMALIVFLVTGLIFLGVATPAESAATGCLGCFILAAVYRRLNWKVLKVSTEASLRTSGIVMLIMATATMFSQILSFSGINQGFIDFLMHLNLPPMVAIVGVQILIAIIACFMPITGILMIVMPLFTPLVIAMGQDPVWFGVITLINAEMGGLTPPFGLNLFTMKSVAPKGTTMEEVYRAAVPFVFIDCGMIILLLALPILCVWLPNLMR